jgi:hypothetical protein
MSEVFNPHFSTLQENHITGKPHYRKTTMSDLDRGIMKFKGADNPIVIAISAGLVLGSIGALVVWALRTAYVVA